LILGAYTGLRRCAIWSLKLSNIYLGREIGIIKIENGYIDLNETEKVYWRNKKRKVVEKPISEVLKQYLLRDMETRHPEERYYLDDGTGYPCYKSPAGLIKAFRLHKQDTGISHEEKPIHAF